jgi:signal transduction histidine kinase
LPQPAIVALAVAGFAFGLGLGPIIADSDHAEPALLYGVLGLFVGWSFIGVGLYAWWRRPWNRVGLLMTATGFLWFVAALGTSNNATVFALANIVGSLYLGTTIHLLLAFPSGRLETPAARVAALAGYALSFGGNLIGWLVLDPQTDFDCQECPENVLQVVHSETLADVVSITVNMLAAGVMVYVLLRLIVSWREAQDWRRRTLTPVVFSGAATAFLVVVTLTVQSFARDPGDAVFITSVAAFAAVPYAFLLGLARSAMLRGGGVGELVARLTETPRGGELQEVLRRALGDPSLDLAYWLPENQEYVDAEGRRIELPGLGDARASAGVELEGRRLGAIVYDGVLVDDPQLVRAVGAAAALAVERERLDAELRANLEELRASRQRLVDAEFQGRRRLERDLHDGAQQRLVSLALNLRLARSKLESGDTAGADKMLESASAELDRALGELRELARGIHPAVLNDRGLDAALQALAARAPLPVEVTELPTSRLPDQIESAAYFVVAEALTNVAKYSQATRANVRIVQLNGRVVVEVSDDGVGGADPAKGSGLRGLSDRVSALEGRLALQSDPGEGTTVMAWIPVR